MIIKIQSVDLPEATIKNFAQFIGWSEFIMTTDQSPNVEIENPQTFTQYIEEKYGSPIRNDVSRWNLQTAEAEAQALKDQADQIIADAKVIADSAANEVITIVIE